MKKLLKVCIFTILLMLPILFICKIKKSTIPPLFFKTNIVPTLYALTNTRSLHITSLKGGLSDSTLYKIEGNDQSYVVRFMGHRSLQDKIREIDAQTIASQEGWAPPLYAADTDEGWIIMKYIKPHSLTQADRMDEETYKKLGTVLQKIHSSPAFLPGKSILAEIEELLVKLQQENKIPLLIDSYVLKNILESVKNNYQRMITPTHRDLNPNNILFSDNQIFIIDFENAAQDDPFYDLATIGIFYIFHPYHEKLFLHAYFDRDPTMQEYSYYEAMKQVALLFYGLNFLEKVPQAIIREVTVTPEPFAKLLEDVAQGKVNIADHTDQLKLGVSILQEAINQYTIKNS